MTPEQEAIDGEKARQLLENSIFKQAWENAEQSIIDQMREVKTRDDEMHTRLILALQVLDRVKNHIRAIAQTGEMAKIQLNEKKRLFRR